MKNNFNGWHVLRVRTRHEKKIHDLLVESSIEVFLPLTETKKQWSDRTKIILEPLFPSYIFIKLNSFRDFDYILKIKGALNFIRFGNDYARLNKEEISNIRSIIRLKDVTEINIHERFPKIGDLKKIITGPLSGLYCSIIRLNSEKKVLVSVNLNSLNQNVTATIPISYFNDTLSLSE